MLLWIFEQKMDFCISVYQSKDEEDGNYQRFSSNLHLFLQRGGGKFNYNLHRTILYSTILTLESGFLTLNERDRHSTHKNTSFSWRQPSYVILFHRNMEMEKWNIVKLDDKLSTFCHVQFHFSFFQFSRIFLLNLGDEKWSRKICNFTPNRTSFISLFGW